MDLESVLTFKIYIQSFFVITVCVCVYNWMKLLMDIFDEHYPGKRISRGF